MKAFMSFDMLEMTWALRTNLDTISGDDGLVRVGVWWTGGQHVESNFLGFKNNPRCFLTKIDVYHPAEFPATFDINSRIQVSTKVQN